MLRQDNAPYRPTSTLPIGQTNAGTRANNHHTILLVQITKSKDTRTFLDFDTPEKAVVGAISLYEDRLRQFNPAQPKIKYTVEDLFEFFEGLGELACLVFDPNVQAYLPKPFDYIKQRCLVYLQGKV